MLSAMAYENWGFLCIKLHIFHPVIQRLDKQYKCYINKMDGTIMGKHVIYLGYKISEHE